MYALSTKIQAFWGDAISLDEFLKNVDVFIFRVKQFKKGA